MLFERHAQCVSFLASLLGAQDTNMTKLVKLFHPHAQPYELRRHTKALYMAIAAGILGALLAAGILYWVQYSEKFRF